MSLRQTIHFTTSFDGVRIAWAESGKGTPLVRLPTWLGHLEHDWTSPVLRHSLLESSSRHRLVRYDARGCGLSDWSAADLSFEACVRDLEAVVDAAGLDRFAMYGGSVGPAIAIAYAARHPERVTHLVLAGSFVRGRRRRESSPGQAERADLLLKLLEVGWGTEEPAFRQVFTSLFVPGGTPEQWRWFSDRMRLATTGANAVRLSRAFQDIDICDLARQVRCPTLVLHARRDAVVPYDEGRLTASLIPGAEFVTLDSANHVILEDEPAWPRMVAELRRFLPQPVAAPDGFAALSERERQVLELIAQGLDNQAIAERLRLAPKTVRNVASSVFAKIGAHSRAQAVAQARDAGFGAH